MRGPQLRAATAVRAGYAEGVSTVYTLGLTVRDAGTGAHSRVRATRSPRTALHVQQRVAREPRGLRQGCDLPTVQLNHTALPVKSRFVFLSFCRVIYNLTCLYSATYIGVDNDI